MLEIFHFGVEGKIADVNGHETQRYGQDSLKVLEKVAGLGEKSFGGRRSGSKPLKEDR
jgi:hypothetical protein